MFPRHFMDSLSFPCRLQPSHLAIWERNVKQDRLKTIKQWKHNTNHKTRRNYENRMYESVEITKCKVPTSRYCSQKYIHYSFYWEDIKIDLLFSKLLVKESKDRLFFFFFKVKRQPAAAAKSRQSCLTLCDPIDSSPPDSPVPGIFQARTLEWVATAFSNAWKWKVKVKWLSRARPSATPWTAAYQAPPPMGFSRQEYWSGVPLPSPRGSLLQYKEYGLWSLCCARGLIHCC